MKALLLVLLLSFQTTLQAQEKDHSTLLNQKKLECEKILAEFSGKPESILLLIKTGKEGLELCKKADYENRFAFNQAIGTGYYYQQDFKSAKSYFEQSYQVASQGGMADKSLKPLGNLISINHYLGLQSQADSTARMLKLAIEHVDNPKGKSDAFYNLGLYYQQQKSYYGIALNNFLKSAELHKSVADTTKTAKLKLDYIVKLAMVAEIYILLKQPEKAIQYLDEARPYMGMSLIVDVAVYGKFIRSYALLKNHAEAQKNYDLLYKTVGNSDGKWSELVSSNLTMAKLALEKQEYPLAKTFIDKADKQSKLDNKEIMTSSVNLSYGEYYRAIKDYPTAIKYFKRSEHGSALFNKEQHLELLGALVAAEIASGGSAETLADYNKYTALSDSLTTQKIELNIAEAEATFQNKLKQEQIEVKTLQLEQNKKERVWLLSGLASLVLVSVLLIIIYQNKKRTANILDEKNKALATLNRELEESNRTKAKLFSIISHDLRSPISQVYQFLKLQQLNPKLLNDDQKAELSEKIQTATGHLLETMEDLLLWSKTQMNEFRAEIRPTELAPVVDQCLKLLQLHLEEKNLTVDSKLSEKEMVLADPFYLETIVRNLLQNAVKVADTGSVIHLDFTRKGQQSVLSIGNSGPAFSNENYQTLIAQIDNGQGINGFGLRLVDELATKTNLKISFETPSDRFTTANVTFEDSRQA